MRKIIEDKQSSKQAGFFGFTRVDLSVPPFIFAGLGAAFFSLMGIASISFSPSPRGFVDWVGVCTILMFFPAFLIATLERRWASLRLWICFLVIAGPAALHPQELMAWRNAQVPVGLLGIVLLTEASRLIRGN
jgi:hypothetical protein